MVQPAGQGTLGTQGWKRRAGHRLRLEEQTCPNKPAQKRAWGSARRGSVWWPPCQDHPAAPQPLPLLCSPKYCKVVPGEGMPLLQDPRRKGDLHIYFNICFPKKLTRDKKLLLKSALLS